MVCAGCVCDLVFEAAGYAWNGLSNVFLFVSIADYECHSSRLGAVFGPSSPLVHGAPLCSYPETKMCLVVTVAASI